MRRIVVLFLGALALSVSFAAVGAGGQASSAYVGDTAGQFLQCRPARDDSVGVGGACFRDSTLFAGATSVKIDADSNVLLTPVFYYADGRFVRDNRSGCGSLTLPVDPGLSQVFVYVTGASGDCGESLPATSGTITLLIN